MKRLAAVLVIVSTAGCGGTLYQIHREPPTSQSGLQSQNGQAQAGQPTVQELEGVPFYVLASACTQETVYLETIYQLSVQVPQKGSTPGIVLIERSVPASVYRSSAIEELRRMVAAPKASREKITAKGGGPQTLRSGSQPRADRGVEHNEG